ncbi:MAG: MFS transporter [Novosphingobium sp.]|nr:MFS transporter [Novosphingobium sp.]
MPEITAKDEWRQGWKVVLASFVGFYSFSILIAAMSAFMGPMAAEFGWSRTLLSAGTSISSIVTMLLAPVLGILVDRYGTRRIALPGVAFSALIVVAMATNTGSGGYWLALWLIYALAGLMVNTPVWAQAVSSVFERSRGMALAIALAGATAAHATIPPMSFFLIDAFGWRLAFVVLGGGLGTIAWIICFAMFFDARDRARMMQARLGKGEAGELTSQIAGLTLAEAWRSTALWRIGISILVIMALTIGFLVHQIEILVSAGVSREQAAWLAGLAGAMGIVGKLVTGVLIDRFPGNWVGGLTMSTAGIAFAMLIGGIATPALIVIAMMVNGYTGGAKLQITSYLTAQFAGMRNFGKIYGAISSLVAVGSGIGPILAGLIYDGTGSYQLFLIGGAIALLMSAALMLSLPRRYPDWTGESSVHSAPA